MKKFMNKLPIWLLLVWPYAFFLGMMASDGSFFVTYTILTISLCVVNMVNAASYMGENTAKELSFWGMMIKLAHMPFYVVVSIITVIAIISMIIEPTAGGITFSLFFMILMGLIFMISSSTYCAKALSIAKDMSLVKKETAMLLGTTCFIMFADVICAILIYSKIKKNKKVKSY